jgi:two-component system phosphate regulon sensor histidine kinase PhoR
METTTTTAILHVLPDSVLLIDAEKQILVANIAAKNLLGDRIEGGTLTLALQHPNILDAVNEVLNGAERRQVRISLFDSARRSFDVQIASLTGTTQYEGDTVLIMHDMTSVQNAEQMRADSIANVSHELRSPLSSLVGFIETLRGPARNDKSASNCWTAPGAAKSMPKAGRSTSISAACGKH